MLRRYQCSTNTIVVVRRQRVNIFNVTPVQISPGIAATAESTPTNNRYFIGEYWANFWAE